MDLDMQCSVIYVTTRDHDEAAVIGRTLVEEQLVACANIVDGMTSIYRWDGKTEEAKESTLLLKTSTHLVNRVTDRVCELHSYDVPCVVSWPIESGNVEYLEWIAGQTADNGRKAEGT